MTAPAKAPWARLEHWWQARLPRLGHAALNHRNVYILPTRAGWMLALTLLVLLLASINYQLNLGYLLTFLIAGCALVAMHVSHANLRGISLSLAEPEPVFMGATARLTVKLDNPSKRPRPALGLTVHHSGQWVYIDLAAQALGTAQLAWQPTQRGLQLLPALCVQTLFPLGTFRVWTIWKPKLQVLVYPQPEAKPPPLPHGHQIGAKARPNSSQQQGELDNIRPYRRGDALKHILWKQVAKTGALVSRESLVGQHQELWLERAQTALIGPEQQLSRLCAWVLQADQLGLRYGLRLGEQSIGPDSGALHLQRCLRSLALA